jgi:hypothetical protein
MPRDLAWWAKTGDADEEGRVLVCPPVGELREWMEWADIKKGPIFGAIDRWEAAEEKALTPQSINLIVKLPEATLQSQHRSVQQAASYYNDAERAQGRAARLGLLRKLSADNFVSPYCRRHWGRKDKHRTM